MNFENSKKVISTILVFAIVFFLTSVLLLATFSTQVHAAAGVSEGNSGTGIIGILPGAGGNAVHPIMPDPDTNPSTGPQDMIPATLIFSTLSALAATGIFIKKRK